MYIFVLLIAATGVNAQGALQIGGRPPAAVRTKQCSINSVFASLTKIKANKDCRSGCAGGRCPKDWYPRKQDKCSAPCGKVFEPFWDQCGPMLTAAKMGGMGEMGTFYEHCLETLYPAGSCGTYCNGHTCAPRVIPYARDRCDGTCLIIPPRVACWRDDIGTSAIWPRYPSPAATRVARTVLAPTAQWCHRPVQLAVHWFFPSLKPCATSTSSMNSAKKACSLTTSRKSASLRTHSLWSNVSDIFDAAANAAATVYAH